MLLPALWRSTSAGTPPRSIFVKLARIDSQVSPLLSVVGPGSPLALLLAQPASPSARAQTANRPKLRAVEPPAATTPSACRKEPRGFSPQAYVARNPSWRLVLRCCAHATPAPPQNRAAEKAYGCARISTQPSGRIRDVGDRPAGGVMAAAAWDRDSQPSAAQAAPSTPEALQSRWPTPAALRSARAASSSWPRPSSLSCLSRPWLAPWW
jgi:hypothetical protein